jgi:hypothetical protein
MGKTHQPQIKELRIAPGFFLMEQKMTDTEQRGLYGPDTGNLESVVLIVQAMHMLDLAIVKCVQGFTDDRLRGAMALLIEAASGELQSPLQFLTPHHMTKN